MKAFKRLFCIIIVALIICAVLPVTVGLADVSGYYTYVLVGSNAAITGYSGPAGAVSIPSDLDGHPVTEIRVGAFTSNNDLTGITIPDSVTTIGGGAFMGCSSLESITIPQNVASIGNYAFTMCYGLKSINVSSSNTHYDSEDGVLFNEGKDELIQYPLGKVNVDESLIDYVMPASVKIIDDKAFLYATKLKSVTITGNLQTIGAYAFSRCDNLESISELPDSVSNIGDRAFSQCFKLTGINVSSTNLVYKSVDGVLFDEAGTKLIQYPLGKAEDTYIVPEGVTTLCEFSFYEGSKLKSLTLPKSLNEIDEAALNLCYSLQTISVTEENLYYTSADGVLFNNDFTTLIKYPAGNTAASYTIPGTVTTIGENAFGYCGSPLSTGNLADITIPDSVTAIAYNAFGNCSKLTEITLPEHIDTIGANAFIYCDALAEVRFMGNAPTTFGGNVFLSAASGFKIYYPGGWSGWSSPTWNGYPAEAFGYSVTFDSRGGGDIPGKTAFNKPITPPGEPHKDGYNFAGWHSDPACTTDWDFSANIVSNTVLYAGWDMITYHLNYNLNGGELASLNPTSYNITSLAITLNNPTKPGYTFTGWTWAGHSTPSAAVTIPAGSIGDRSFTANWAPVVYSVTYSLGGGTASNPESYTVESAFTLNNPVRTGYNFAGWSGTGISGTSASVTVPAGSTGARTYTAVWTLIEYAVTYDLGGGMAINPTSYTIESAAFTLNNPTRYGYNFAGWSGTGISGTSMNVTIPAGSTGARGYTANWSAQPQTLCLLSPGNSSGSISPAFDKNKTSYKVTIGESDASFTLAPVKEFDAAALTINKQARASLTLPIANGKSVKFTVKVTLGKQSKSYTFTVTRAKSTNNALASLTATAGTWSQPFDPNVTNYMLTLDENTKSTAIKAVSAVGKLAGISPASSKVTLNNGQSKAVKITVKAQSGAKRTYTITVVRAASANADLKSLKATGLTPGFNPAQTNYSIALPANKSSVSISAKAAGYKAAVSIDGGKASKNVTVANGQVVTVRVVVTAQAGNKKEYIISVTRGVLSSPSVSTAYTPEGMYQAGRDIPAGEYFIKSTGSLPCYIELASDASGTLDSIVANDLFLGFAILTVGQGQYMTVERGSFCPLTQAPAVSPVNNIWSQGMYKVGQMLPVGEYIITPLPGEMGYYEISQDSSHLISSIIANDVFYSQRIVSVANGQYLTVSRATFQQR